MAMATMINRCLAWTNSADQWTYVGALIAAYSVLRLLSFLFERRRLHATFERMQVPHTRPHLISGHLYQTRREPYVKFAHKLHERLGKNVGMFLGGDPFLLTKDLDLIQQIFVAKSRLFYNRQLFYLNVDPVPDNLICQRGERWRYMRRLLTPFFANAKIKSSQFYLDSQKTFEKFHQQLAANSSPAAAAATTTTTKTNTTTQRTTETAANRADNKPEAAPSSSVTLVEDVYDRMAAIALDVICKTAFHMDNMISFEGPLMSASSPTRGQQQQHLARGKEAAPQAQAKEHSSWSLPISDHRDAFLTTVKRACKLGFNPLVELIFCFPFLDPLLTYICGKLVFHSILKLLLNRLDYLVRRDRSASLKTQPAEATSKPPPTQVDDEQTQQQPAKFEQMPIQQRKRIIDSLIEVLRERKITKSEFVGNALVIVFAGFETTANAFTFTLWLLAKHPDVQQKLRNHLRAKMQSIREQNRHLLPPSAGHANANANADAKEQRRQQLLCELELNELATGCEYLENVINESLRLYPPVPALSGRQASVDCVMSNGLRIERGVTVLPSIWSIHRDKSIWGQQANEFQPERFELLDINQLNSAMFMPFGLGPRNCIGKAVAMHEIKIIVGRMVLEYAIETSATLTPDKLRICSPINITITNSETIGLKFVKLNTGEQNSLEPNSSPIN